MPLGSCVERAAYLFATASSGSRLELSTSLCALGRALTSRVQTSPDTPSHALHHKSTGAYVWLAAACSLFTLPFSIVSLLPTTAPPPVTSPIVWFLGIQELANSLYI